MIQWIFSMDNWLQILFQPNQNRFTYHYIYLDNSNNLLENEDYYFEVSIGEISIKKKRKTIMSNIFIRMMYK